MNKKISLFIPMAFDQLKILTFHSLILINFVKKAKYIQTKNIVFSYFK